MGRGVMREPFDDREQPSISPTTGTQQAPGTALPARRLVNREAMLKLVRLLV